MDVVQFREPVSAWSHFIWMILAIPGTVLLCWRSRHDPFKQLSMFVYGLSLISCFAGSVLYHGVHDPRMIDFFAIVDFIGIYLLVGGSYTPPAFNLMEGLWKWGVLATVWLLVAAGVGVNLLVGEMAPWLYTSLYLALGWGALLSYFEIARSVGHRKMSPLLIGGIVYSTGAMINRWWYPSSLAHDIMHLFIMLGSLIHYWFILAVIVPYDRKTSVIFRLAASRCSGRMAVSSPEMKT